MRNAPTGSGMTVGSRASAGTPGWRRVVLARAVKTPKTTTSTMNLKKMPTTTPAQKRVGQPEQSLRPRPSHQE